MARVQILQLPPYGPDGEQPFALIVDQVTAAPDDTSAETRLTNWQAFSQEIGARSVLVTDEHIDIAGEETTDNLLVEFDNAALGESVVAALRAHLESPEASDAVRAWYESRRRPSKLEQMRDARRQGDGSCCPPRTEVHHHHGEASYGGAAMRAVAELSEAQRRGGR